MPSAHKRLGAGVELRGAGKLFPEFFFFCAEVFGDLNSRDDVEVAGFGIAAGGEASAADAEALAVLGAGGNLYVYGAAQGWNFDVCA